MSTSNFGERLKQLRREKNLTQAQLAERVGVSKTSANLYESATRVPDIQVLARYAKELEVTSDYLLGLSDNRTQETAAIGDKLGLNDESIEHLIKYVEYRNGSDDFEKKSDVIIYQNSDEIIETINMMIGNPALLSAIYDYITAQIDKCIKMDDVKERYDIYDVESVRDFMNMWRIQRNLELIRKSIDR